METDANADNDIYYQPPEGVICLDELQKSLNMHEFDARTASAMEKSNSVQVPKDAVEALRDYVTIIASSYNDNPFHNFAHYLFDYSLLLSC